MTSVQTQQGSTVDIPWIVAHGSDKNVRLVEVDVNRSAYDEGHIPGAVHWDAYADLRDKEYRLVSLEQLRQLLSRSGITPDTTIVVYGYGAALGFWLLKSVHHREVRMLTGPRTQWAEAGEQWSTDKPRFEETSYPPLQQDENLAVSREAVEASASRPDWVVLDARSREEYAGLRFWPSGATEDVGRAGHIPGAVNVPIDVFRRSDGTPKRLEELTKQLEDAGVTRGKRVVTYCTIGNRASEAWFTLTQKLDYPDVGVYYGSWVEWGKLSDTPIE